jgi:hypothetical protein
MATITITHGGDSGTFFSYATVATADTYMLGSINHTVWDARSDAEKERDLIEATRLLDRQKWRSEYNTQALREAQTDIVNACIELAFLIATGNTETITNGSTFDNTKRAKAGSVETENFRPFSGLDSPKRFPQNIWEMLRNYMLGGGSIVVAGAYSSGTSGTSSAFDEWGYGGR